MALVDEKVSYLEMHAHASRHLTAPGERLDVIHARNPTVGYYRFLYHAVGKEYYWRSRGLLSHAELAAVLQNPLDEVHVLHVEGTPAGFAELDRRARDDIELVHFGLMAEFIGRGPGRYFLQWVVDKAWSYHPKRLWLHTCNFDHPVALPTYLKAGFTVFREEMKKSEIPDK
jgi:GNAT superfamily N-acetyltransferase